jgi:hypothetical protein
MDNPETSAIFGNTKHRTKTNKTKTTLKSYEIRNTNPTIKPG